MIIPHSEAQVKLSKLRTAKNALEFALSPQGFLLIRQGRVLDCEDYRLFYSGNFLRRDGFVFNSSIPIPDGGQFLCITNDGKFLGIASEADFELSSPKKPLTAKYSFLLMLRAANRIIVIIADGDFSSSAFTITLSDTTANASFALSLMIRLIEQYDAEIPLWFTDVESEVANSE